MRVEQAERQRLAREPRLDKSMWERQNIWVRCITRGQPAGTVPVVYNNNYQIVQAPGYVVLYQEMVHAMRIIPMDGRPHLPSGFHLWQGDSRAHWEGNELIVETTNFHDEVHTWDNLGIDGGGSLGVRQPGEKTKLHQLCLARVFLS